MGKSGPRRQKQPPGGRVGRLSAQQFEAARLAAQVRQQRQSPSITDAYDALDWQRFGCDKQVFKCAREAAKHRDTGHEREYGDDPEYIAMMAYENVRYFVRAILEGTIVPSEPPALAVS